MKESLSFQRKQKKTSPEDGTELQGVGKGFGKLQRVGVEQESYPQLMPSGEKGELEEAVKQPEVSAMIEADEMGGGDGCKMDAKPKNPQKGQSSAPGTGRKKKCHGRERKESQRTAVYLGILVAITLLHVTDAFPAGFCYTCKDKEKCQHLLAIYDGNNDTTPLYSRPLDEDIPECSRSSTPLNICFACRGAKNVLIHCSKNITNLQPEGNSGFIDNVSPGCEQELKSDVGHHAHLGLIFSAALFAIVIVIAILACWRSKL
ncbi:uncharacterized protein LOC133441109 isoform X2 [Cololabis saira]|nr:uncharacterized protein LOC133441109 isoform X2 [Cololabis saira]